MRIEIVTERRSGDGWFGTVWTAPDGHAYSVYGMATEAAAYGFCAEWLTRRGRQNIRDEVHRSAQAPTDER